MLAVKVMITRYAGDEPQPGIVECELLDVHGQVWHFVEKIGIVSANDFNAETNYPQRGVIAGAIVARSRNAAGQEVVQFDTERPWGVESIDGVTQFDVLADWLIEI
jgi:hypothetical protein